MPLSDVDQAFLLKARLYVGRLGEADVQGWWQTDGVLGADGAFVGPRVLPLTHPTARARIVLAAAAHACSERHPDQKALHLFRLGPSTEDALDALIGSRLSDREFWTEAMLQLEAILGSSDPAQVLASGGIVREEELRLIEKLSLGPGGRSLPIPPAEEPDATLRRLAAGFVRSTHRSLVVPYLQARG